MGFFGQRVDHVKATGRIAVVSEICNARGIHAGPLLDFGGLHESFGARWQSVGDGGSGEHLYEAWQLRLTFTKIPLVAE